MMHRPSPRTFGYLLMICLAFTGCQPDQESVRETHCYQLPAGTHLPRFDRFQALRMSYVHSSPDGDSLFVHDVRDTVINPLRALFAPGDDLFVNWADFPSILFYDDTLGQRHTWAHYLQYSGEGTYDYDIMTVDINAGTRSVSSGKLHADTVSAEHGFLSSARLPGGGLQVAWLDGRFTKGGADAGAEGIEEAEGGHGHTGSPGAMTLRTKNITDPGSTELDHRVCDCCNTTTVATDSLVMIAYRDRDEHEIRDISYVLRRVGEDDWSVPKRVHADNWQINGCPVNGPQLAANAAGEIAIAWYTELNGTPRTYFARYDAENDRFTSPTLLDGDAPYGRVALHLAADGTARVLSLAQGEEGIGQLMLYVVSPGNKVTAEPLGPMSTNRSSGFPQLDYYADTLRWAYTVPGEGFEHYVEVCRR